MLVGGIPICGMISVAVMSYKPFLVVKLEFQGTSTEAAGGEAGRLGSRIAAQRAPRSVHARVAIHGVPAGIGVAVEVQAQFRQGRGGQVGRVSQADMQEIDIQINKRNEN